jgi:hypothetical protein
MDDLFAPVADEQRDAGKSNQKGSRSRAKTPNPARTI